MSKVVQRLLTFFLGIPLVLGFIFLDPTPTHFAINCLAIVFSFFAAKELYELLAVKTELRYKYLILFLSALQPLATFLLILTKKSGSFANISTWTFLLSAMLIMALEVFTTKTFENSNGRLTASLFIIFYAGFLFTFISKLTLLKNATFYLSLFLFTVFINDSLAWFFGVLFGKNNRGIVAASPNKSLAGFLGGYAGAIASCVLASLLWKDIFTGPWYYGAALGFATATAGIIGDLIESVFKRSSEIKDSGNIIPGRGGILDSVDSILFSAPVFYILSYLLFRPEFIEF